MFSLLLLLLLSLLLLFTVFRSEDRRPMVLLKFLDTKKLFNAVEVVLVNVASEDEIVKSADHSNKCY